MTEVEDGVILRFIESNPGCSVKRVSTMFGSESFKVRRVAEEAGLFMEPFGEQDARIWPEGHPHEVSCSDAVDLIVDDPGSVIVLDTETTGLDPMTDELLSIAIIDGNGTKLFDSLLHPYRTKSWPKAQKINRISPAMVRDAPSVYQVRRMVDSILSRARVIVGYNVGFDCGFLARSGFSVPVVNWCDVMEDFVDVLDVTSGSGHRWQKLTTCAEHYGYTFVPHSAFEDALATLHCCRCIAEDQRRLRT